MDVIDRLHLAVRESGIPRKVIEQRTGIRESKLSRLLTHKIKKPSIHDIEAVLAAIGMTMEQLFAGPPVVGIRDALRAVTEYVDRHEGSAPPAARATVPASNIILFPDGTAGARRVAEGILNRSARHTAQVIGESLHAEGLHDGDVVAFRPESEPERAEGELVVCRLGSLFHLRRLRRTGNTIRLDGEPPITIRAADDFELYGIVLI